MKKIITKFWGLALIVVLLSSMFVAAAPVSANALQYSAEFSPNSMFGPISAVQIFSVAINGDTVYVATGTHNPAGYAWGIYKSTNGGASFIPISAPTVAPVSMNLVNFVAVAPDDANFIAAMNGTTFNVWVSANGGTTWSNVGVPHAATSTNVALTANDLDVSPTYNGGHFISVAGTAATGPALFVFNTAGGLGSSWTNAAADLASGVWAQTGNNTAVYAAAFSPAFAGDLTAVFVSGNATGRLALHTVRFSVGGTFDEFPGYANNAATITGTTAVGTVNKVDLELFPDYSAADETLRSAFVACSVAGTDMSGLYRMSDATGTPRSVQFETAGTELNSVAYDGTTVIAGSYDSNIVYFSNAPLAPAASAALTADRSTKRSGLPTTTNKMDVGFVGTNIVSGSQGTETAFAVSTDGGLTFNDVALINTTVSSIDDIQISADGTKKYQVTTNTGVSTSIWYFDGAWTRVKTLDNTTAGYIVRAAPDNFSVVYVGDTTGTSLLYSADAGKAKWTTFPVPAIGDIAVESADVLYVAVSGTGTVAKSINHGFSFSTATGPTGFAAINSIRSIAANQIVIGSTSGTVQWSTDGGTTWQFLLQNPGFAATGARTFAVADKLDAGGIIYATANTTTLVYRWVIGTSTVWDSIGGSQTSGYTNRDIRLSNGTLYTLGTNGTNAEIARSINPSFGLPGFVAWSAVQTTNPDAFHINIDQSIVAGANVADAGSGNLVLVGNTAYFIDSTNKRILTYTDTLTAATAVPAITAPANDFLVQTVGLNNTPNPLTIIWAPIAGVTAYQVQVAQDSAFFQQALTNGTLGTVTVNFATNIIVGSAGGGTMTMVPGMTYYYRIRASAPFYSNWSEVRTFRVQPSTAVVPTISSPLNGSTLSGAAAFSWSPVGGTTMYKFEIDTGTSFTAPLYSVDTPTAGAMLPVNIKLEPGRTYFWRVKALAPIEGDWSTVANFTVAAEATATTTAAPVTPTITITQPQATTTVITIPTQAQPDQVSPAYIWAIIIIGAVLVIAVIVLIVRTRRSV